MIGTMKSSRRICQTASDGMDLCFLPGMVQRLDVFVDRACLDEIEKAAATTKDKFLKEYAEN